MPDQSFRLGAPGNSPVILAQSAIPFVLPSSGTFTGGTGALSALTALPTTYSGGCFMYFPAGAGLPQGAGWYWTVMSSTTAGTVYNNVYSSGDPKLAVPSSPTSISSGATSYTQSTSEINSVQITIPGGSMGPNGQLHIIAGWSANNAAGNRAARTEIGGSTLYAVNLTSTPGYGQSGVLANRNSQASQVVLYGNQGAVGAAGALTFSSHNTAVDQTLNFSHTLPAATDYLTLEHFDLRVQYGA